MQTKCLKIREIEFGSAIPKICVPIVAEKKEDILSQATELLKKKPDCMELRADWFSEVRNQAEVIQLLQELRRLVGDMVLLFTFRTQNEGGEKEIAAEDYKHLCEMVCKSGYIDLIDVEAYKQDGLLEEICKIAHDNKVYVVASNHDFEKTPAEEEIINRLQYMDKAGADIPKIAVMPNSERDVLHLLSATLKYRECGGVKPIITMAMGSIGEISRLCGGIFGSAVTFAAGQQASAPGQVQIDDVKTILNIIYKNK